MLCPFFFNAIIYLHYKSDTLAAFYVKNDCDDIQYNSYIDNWNLCRQFLNVSANKNFFWN